MVKRFKIILEVSLMFFLNLQLYSQILPATGFECAVLQDKKRATGHPLAPLTALQVKRKNNLSLLFEPVNQMLDNHKPDCSEQHC